MPKPKIGACLPNWLVKLLSRAQRIIGSADAGSRISAYAKFRRARDRSHCRSLGG
jgi:hypothetical protein